MELDTKLLSGERTTEKSLYQKDYAGEPIPVESTGDYILPDYQPEIRKILRILSEILPSGRYESGGRAEAGGTVRHTLIYTDAEGKVETVELSSDYDYSVDGGDAADRGIVFGQEKILSVNCRLSGPRRLSIRTKIAATLHLLAEKSAACTCLGFDSDTVTDLQKEYPVLVTQYAEEEISLTGEAACPVANCENLRILSTEGVPQFRESRVQKDGVLLRGDLLCKVMVTEDSGTPMVLTYKLPFENTLFVSDPSPEAAAVAHGFVKSLTVSVADSGNGMATVTLDAQCLLSAELRYNRPLSVTTDVYSDTREVQEDRENLTITQHAGSAEGRFPVSGNLSRQMGDFQDAVSLVDASGTAILQETEYKNGVAYLTGECRIRLLLSLSPDEGGNIRLQTAELLLPFRGECDWHGKEIPHRFLGDVNLCTVNARLEENGVVAEADIGYTLAGFRDEQVSILASVSAGEPIAKEAMSRVIVIYPEPGDTLWKIGKRYRVALNTLKEVNELPTGVIEHPDTEASLHNITRLFIVE